MPGTRPIAPDEEAAIQAVLPQFSLRDQALVAVLANTGLRISEALSLKLGEVWAPGGIRERVRLQRSHLKGGRGAYRRSVAGRSVPLNAAVAAVLERYLFGRFGSAGPADAGLPLFPSRKGGVALTPGQGTRLVQAVLAAAGVAATGARELGAHSWRKSFCGKIYAATRDLNLTRAAMGHANIGTTVRYLTVDAAEVDRAILAIGTGSERVATGQGTGRSQEKEVAG